MNFASPWWLLALALIPALVSMQRLAARRRRRYAVRFPATATATAALAETRLSTWRRRLPVALLLAAIAFLALSLARPRLPYRVPVGEASTMLVTDHSGSMAASDVQPTRLAAAIHAADAFIDSLPSTVRVGAVAFGSSPDAAQPPASDHSAARSLIDEQIANGATDTGDALALALTLLRGADPRHPPSAIVLLSDGSANAGVNVTTVARQAAHQRIPIYTVALGTADGTLDNPDPLGPPIPVPPDPQLMAQIAQLSGGRTFNARSADELSSIYQHLANQLGSITRRRIVTAPLEGASALLILIAIAASLRWTGRLP